jgi:hypothetical protein
MSAHGTVTDTRGSLPKRILGVVADGETYRNLAYLLLRFPLGVAYFTTFVTALSLGVALTPLLVGIPILAGTLGLANYAGVLEVRLARGLLGVDATWEPTDATDLPLWPYLKTVGTDPHNYLLVAYLLATFFLGTSLFVVLVTGLVLAAALAVAPLAYPLPFTNYEIPTSVTVGELSVGPVVVDTLPEALAASVVGVALGVALLHLSNGLARGLGWLTCRLFAQNR